MRWSTTLTILLVAACGGDDGADAELPVAPRCEVAVPERTALTVDGTRIVDGHGRTVHLRGVNAGGRSKFAPYAPFDFAADEPEGYRTALAEYVGVAGTWGINVLRVPFSWQALEPIEGQIDEAYLSRLDALIDAAWQNGMWTILDFHQDLYAEPFCGDGFPSWTLTQPGPPRHDCADWHTLYDSSEVQAAFDAFWSDSSGVRTKFVAMWQRMIERYRDHPGVIGYEPINEPHQGTAAASEWARTTLTSFYSEMAALIGAADPGALVFIDTTALDGVRGSTSLEKPAGQNLVLAPHSYDPLALFGDEVSPDVEPRLAPWAELGAAWNMPVLIGEMGIRAAHPDAAVHLRRHLDALEALGMHGTWWEYSRSADIWNHEELSLVAADGSETAMVAELARPFLGALGGALGSASYDPDLRRLTVRYQPDPDAPTLISTSNRRFEDEYRIVGRGVCFGRGEGGFLVRPTGNGEVEVGVQVAPWTE
jgi:endoglycosylceramidase